MSAHNENRGSVTVAAMQTTPVFLDRQATVEHLVDEIGRAASAGARLIVFPEAIVPGYPDWVWRTPAWNDRPWYARLHANAVDVPGPATDRLGEAARDAGAWVAVGVTERTPSETLYNSIVYIDPAGDVAAVHRKLVPTGGERTVWGQAPAALPAVVDTAFGRVGGLICWENLMPLARLAVFEQHVDIYIAPTWDSSEAWLSTLRHIAREGRVFVIGTNSCLRASDVPRHLDGAAEIYGDGEEWMSRGNTAIIGPNGDVLAGPLTGRAGMLVANLNLDMIAGQRREFDAVGHYSRPDAYRIVMSGG